MKGMLIDYSEIRENIQIIHTCAKQIEMVAYEESSYTSCHQRDKRLKRSFIYLLFILIAFRTILISQSLMKAKI